MAEPRTPKPQLDGSRPLEQYDSEQLERSTALGSKRIFRRFVLLVLGIDLVIGVGMVVYDVSDTIDNTEYLLETSSERLVEVCRRLRQRRPQMKPAQVVVEAAALTGVPIALLSKDGQVHVASDGKHPPDQVAATVTRVLPHIFPDGRPAIGTWVEIHKELESLSGAWSLTAFDDGLLLVVVPRLPEQEGLLRYMTLGAAVMGLGLVIALLFMVLSANWVLHKPLRGLVEQLTGALARDIQRRIDAEQEANRARYEAERHLAFRDQLIDASAWLGIVATGPDSVIQVFNRGAQQLLGFSEKETTGVMKFGQLREQLHRPASTPVPLREFIQLAESEEFAVDKEGREHLLQTDLSDITDSEGATIGQLLLFFDVTRRKHLEAELDLNKMQLLQASKMASLGEMATGVAHELNQPLNNIGLLSSRMTRRVARLSDEDAPFLGEKLEKIQGQLSQIYRAGKILFCLRQGCS